MDVYHLFGTMCWDSVAWAKVVNFSRAKDKTNINMCNQNYSGSIVRESSIVSECNFFKIHHPVEKEPVCVVEDYFFLYLSYYQTGLT